MNTPRHRAEPETLHCPGVSCTTILQSEDTGGNLSILDSTSSGGSGSSRHVHRREDEIFVLTDMSRGQFRISADMLRIEGWAARLDRKFTGPPLGVG